MPNSFVHRRHLTAIQKYFYLFFSATDGTKQSGATLAVVRTYLPLPVPAATCRGRRQQPTPPPPELRRATELTVDGAGEGLQPAGVGKSTEAPGPWLNLSSKERPG